MSLILGIDTSNYTTSAALYDTGSCKVVQQKMLLPVKQGQLGLRQSDAVFHHVKQLPNVISTLFSDISETPAAVGVSIAPRPVKGSYMPCFEVGRSAAEQLSAVLNIPLYRYSHQEGHIAAALYSVGCLETMSEKLIAFHLSGGTTEAVLASRNDCGFDVEYICGSLDLKAGQAVDRVAGMLSLPFPGGKHLDFLAAQCNEKIRVKPTMKGLDCCLSGVENKCRALVNDGYAPAYVARFCIEYISETLCEMVGRIREKYGELPVLFAGGVSSNTIIRSQLQERFSDCMFGTPEYSCDNAAGIALLAAMEENR